MPGTNRHRPPSLLQLVRRIYRHQLRMAKDVARADAHDMTVTVLLTHLRRLLREKETLLKIIEANPQVLNKLPRRGVVATATKDDSGAKYQYGTACTATPRPAVDATDDYTVETLARDFRERPTIPCPCTFKDAQCAYTGPEISCNKSWQRCRELGNLVNFRGWARIREANEETIYTSIAARDISI